MSLSATYTSKHNHSYVGKVGMKHVKTFFPFLKSTPIFGKHGGALCGDQRLWHAPDEGQDQEAQDGQQRAATGHGILCVSGQAEMQEHVCSFFSWDENLLANMELTCIRQKRCGFKPVTGKEP
jgi:hypothetical protein